MRVECTVKWSWGGFNCNLLPQHFPWSCLWNCHTNHAVDDHGAGGGRSAKRPISHSWRPCIAGNIIKITTTRSAVHCIHEIYLSWTTANAISGRAKFEQINAFHYSTNPHPLASLSSSSQGSFFGLTQRPIQPPLPYITTMGVLGEMH